MKTKIAYDQHDLLHKNFPGDCCLCKAEDEIRRLEHKLFKLEILPDEEEIKNIINGLTSLALWEAINKEGAEGIKAYIARLSKVLSRRIEDGKCED